MSRISVFRRVVLTTFAVLATGVGMVKDPALGTPPDRALADSLAHGGLDPVLQALHDGHLVRAVAPPVPGAVKLAAVTFGYGLTGDQLSALDVSGTLPGRQAIRDFTARLGAQGIDVSRTQWQVFTLPPIEEASAAAAAEGASEEDVLGSSLIVPAGTAIRFVGALFQNGELRVNTSVTAPAVPGGDPPKPAFRAMESPSNSVTFVPAGGVGCLERKQNSTAHYDPCQAFWRATNDNSTSRDWFASEMHGTGKSHSIWRLRGLEVDSHRTKDTALQEWVNWEPGADAPGHCEDQTIGVSYAGASVTVSKPHCEMWDIDKGREALDMSNWWRGDTWREERSTAAITLTTVKQGEVPYGDFDFDYIARP